MNAKNSMHYQTWPRHPPCLQLPTVVPFTKEKISSLKISMGDIHQSANTEEVSSKDVGSVKALWMFPGLTEPHPRLRLDFHGHCPAPDAWPSPYWTAPQVKARLPWSLPAPDAWPSPYWTALQVKAGLPWSLPCTWCLALTLLNRAPG